MQQETDATGHVKLHHPACVSSQQRRVPDTSVLFNRPHGHISIGCVQTVPLNVTLLMNKPIRKRNARHFGWDGGRESGADRLGVLRGNISPPQPDAGDKDTLQPNSSWKMLSV